MPLLSMCFPVTIIMITGVSWKEQADPDREFKSYVRVGERFAKRERYLWIAL